MVCFSLVQSLDKGHESHTPVVLGEVMPVVPLTCLQQGGGGGESRATQNLNLKMTPQDSTHSLGAQSPCCMPSCEGVWEVKEST